MRPQPTMKTNKHPTLSNGKVCYLEIPAIDINRSASFYKSFRLADQKARRWQRRL
jgi:hypothetical protein